MCTNITALAHTRILNAPGENRLQQLYNSVYFHNAYSVYTHNTHVHHAFYVHGLLLRYLQTGTQKHFSVTHSIYIDNVHSTVCIYTPLTDIHQSLKVHKHTIDILCTPNHHCVSGCKIYSHPHYGLSPSTVLSSPAEFDFLILMLRMEITS